MLETAKRRAQLITLAGGIACAWAWAGARAQSASEYASTEPVGILGTNRYYTPANQVLTPAGLQIELPGMRPQALALSPDGRLLVTAGKAHQLVVLDPASGKVLQRVALPAGGADAAKPAPVAQEILHPDKTGQLSFTGLAFSPDGRRIYLANVNGDIKVFEVRPNGQVVACAAFGLPPANAPTRRAEIPAGLAASRDGKRLYVALNLSNRLAELDAESGRVLRLWDVGVAPFGVTLLGHKLYVSNWGGRRPTAQSTTGPAGRGTRVRVDPVRYIAAEGSVSVIDLGGAGAAGGQEASREVLTGLHACAMALAPNGRWLVVANAGSDTLSVLDTRTERLVETICARQNPADLFGAQPDALAFDRSGRTLFACNASQNAVAVFDFNPGQSKLRGLIPVGWFPGAVVFDSRRRALYVANIKGIGSTQRLEPGEARKFNSHQFLGSLSLVPLPQAAELARLTQIARGNLRYPLLEAARLPARPGQPPRAVPERVGEPSLIHHVIYIIQENRTYDQVLGDLAGGNGDRSLCVFDERITPNHHQVARQFVLLDNTYCCGVLSADGHQWADSAMATDYLERSFAGFPRSYVHGMTDGGVDALAYSPAGFIWDDAIAHGKTLRDYGEFAITEAHWKDKSRRGRPRFLDFFKELQAPTGALEISSRPAIESLRPYLCTNTVGWALSIPDMFRARQFINELHQFERAGRFPDLTLICLPNDHTMGTRAGAPTPQAMAADNDLAFGRILEAVSHSRFWKDSCLFCIEDDPQAGWDHVSGYRTTCYIASPYARRGLTVGVQYNQTSVLRTMELMLGLPPMNQMDATATPMRACFTDMADCTPYSARTNNMPLNQLNPTPKRVSDPLLRKNAYASARLPLAQPDQCPEDTLNRILWYALKGSQAPYPARAVQPALDED